MPARLKIGKLVVIGVGLIGGSFALALKRARAVKLVVGVGRNPRQPGRRARSRRNRRGDAGSCPRGSGCRSRVARHAGRPDVPLPWRRIAPHLSPHTVVTDAGSTKRDVIAHARRFLDGNFSRFVPAHPIAGTEKSGATAAFPDLFRGRTVILTPQAETAAGAVRLVRSAWEICGGRVLRLTPRSTMRSSRR